MFDNVLKSVSRQVNYLRDWSRSGGSYGNNTRVICCYNGYWVIGLIHYIYYSPNHVPSHSHQYIYYLRRELRSRDVPAPDNKSRGCCCRDSRPTVINPDYNMTKQRCMKRIYDKIRPTSPPNQATSPTCLDCDVTHLSLATGVVALHIPSWRIEVREERRQARKIMCQLMQEEWFVAIKIIYVESSITINI